MAWKLSVPNPLDVALHEKNLLQMRWMLAQKDGRRIMERTLVTGGKGFGGGKRHLCARNAILIVMQGSSNNTSLDR
jgi:hypothetical protein